MESWAYYENEHKLEMLGFKCDVAKVSKIKFKPAHSKKFNLTCNLQVQDPADHVLEKIVACLHENRKVNLIQAEQLPLK